MTNLVFKFKKNLNLNSRYIYKMFFSANGDIINKKNINKEGFINLKWFHSHDSKDQKSEDINKLKSDLKNLNNDVSSFKDTASDIKEKIKSIGDFNSKTLDAFLNYDEKLNYFEKIHDEMDDEINDNEIIIDEMKDQISGFVNKNGNISIGTDNPKMAVTGSGNVGIGTTAPTRKLDVNGNVIFRGADFRLDNKDRRNGEGGDHRRALVHDNNDQLTINYNNDYKGGVKIGNNMKVLNDGNVGIGTHNPNAGLQVYNNNGAIISSAIASGERTAVLRLGTPYAKDHDAYCAKITSTNNHSSNYSSDLRFYTHDSEKLGNDPVPDAKERMSILSNGNVGIGTSNPVGKLHTRLVKQVGKYKIRHHRSDDGYSSKNIIHQNLHDAKSLYANRENIDFISFVNSNTLYTHNMALHDPTNWYELNLRYAHSGEELAKDFLPMETDYTIIAYQKEANAPAIIEGDIDQNISSYDPSHSDYSQLSIQSISKTGNSGKRNKMALKIGADHNTKTGYLQTVSPFIHSFNLALQPRGGNVGIGTTAPTRKLDVNGNVIFRGADFRLDNKDRRNGEGGDHRRALVHDTNDQLTINFNNDYKGGVKIGNKMKVFNDGQVNATKFCIGDICLTSEDFSKIKNLD